MGNQGGAENIAPSSAAISNGSTEERPEKTIRNIQVSPRTRPSFGSGEMRDVKLPASRRLWFGRYTLWGAVALALVFLGAIALVAFRPTSVTVIPRSHTVLFDETAHFTAYPSNLAATGTLTFSIDTIRLEDSQILKAQGTEHVQEKAQGTITIFNEYSAQPVKLIKNTRFETPDGLIFRMPGQIIVPGKRGSTPGEIDVTVFADAPGEKYNVGPVSKFIIPGLKSTPAMLKGVYARSSTAMSGGFAGDRPVAPPGAVDTAKSEIRTRLQEKIRLAARERTTDATRAFPELAHITFESLPPTTENGGIRMRERATVEIPLFSASLFAEVIARSVSAEAESGGITLKAGSDFSARAVRTPGSNFATTPLEFVLHGTAQLIWSLDASELSRALAGREEAAFETIVASFPTIEEAHARIEPFWRKSFPANPADIRIKVAEPKPTS